MSSIGGTRKLQAAQKEWSRRFAPATMPAMIAEAMETMPQMAMAVGMGQSAVRHPKSSGARYG